MLEAEDGYVVREGVAHLQVEPVAAVGAEGRREAVEEAAQVAHDVLGPRGLEVAAKKRREARVEALLGGGDAVDGADAVEARELVVDAQALLVGGHGRHARDVGEDRGHAQVARDGDALVALLHVEALQVLVDDDRVAQPLGALGVDEVAPLHRELGLGLRDGVEAAGEHVLSAARLGARDEREVHLGEADGHLALVALVLEYVVQRGRVRVVAVRDVALDLPEAELASLSVVLEHGTAFPRHGIDSPCVHGSASSAAPRRHSSPRPASGGPRSRLPVQTRDGDGPPPRSWARHRSSGAWMALLAPPGSWRLHPQTPRRTSVRVENPGGAPGAGAPRRAPAPRDPR